MGAVDKRDGILGVLGRCTGKHLVEPAVKSLRNVVLQMNQNVFETDDGNL